MKTTIYEIVRELPRECVGFSTTIDGACEVARESGPGQYGVYRRTYEGSASECIIEARRSVIPPEGVETVADLTVTQCGAEREVVKSSRVSQVVKPRSAA